MKNSRNRLAILMLAILMIVLSACACAEASVTRTKASTNANGSVTVSWSYSGQEDPVAYVFCMSTDPQMKCMTAARASGSKATLHGMPCGYDYIIELYDSSFNMLSSFEHTVVFEEFTDLKTLKFESCGVVKMDAGENKFRNKNIVKSPRAQTLCNAMASNSDHRFYVNVYTPPIAKGERSYVFMLAVTAPSGYTETYSGNFVLENVGKRTDWTIWPLSLQPFYEENELTAGRYKVRLYLDGGLVDTKTIFFK